MAGDIHQVRQGVLGAIGTLLCLAGAAVCLIVAINADSGGTVPTSVITSACVIVALAFLVGASLGIRAIRTAVDPLRPLPKPGDGESVWPGPF